MCMAKARKLGEKRKSKKTKIRVYEFLTSVSFEFHHPNNMQVKKPRYNETKPSMSLAFQKMKLCSRGDEDVIIAFLKTKLHQIKNSWRNQESSEEPCPEKHKDDQISSSARQISTKVGAK